MTTATFIRKLEGFRGDARLFRLSDPVRVGWDRYDDEPDERPFTDYVIVSAIRSAFDTGRPETCIFAANAEGKITFWNEMDGSFSGDTDHERAIRGAGWEVAV